MARRNKHIHTPHLAIPILVGIVAGFLLGSALSSNDMPPLESLSIQMEMPAEEAPAAVEEPSLVYDPEVVTEPLPDTVLPPPPKPKRAYIEVIDVNEAGDKCIIRVGDTITSIDEGELKLVNNVYIYVAEVEAMHSSSKDNDICEIVVGARITSP